MNTKFIITVLKKVFEGEKKTYSASSTFQKSLKLHRKLYKRQQQKLNAAFRKNLLSKQLKKYNKNKDL